MDTAVVLVSGGVNSLVTAGLASKEYAVALMHVSFGQRTEERDLACFNGICEHFKPDKRLVVTMDHFQGIGGCSRVDRKLAIEDAQTLRDEIPSTYMPGLMEAMLALAFNWASVIGARHIIVGTSEDDGGFEVKTSSLFPDHRREMYHLYGQLMEMVGKDARIQLYTPLIEMGRGEVIRLGERIVVPFEETWSCLVSSDKSCGKCYGCASRAHGFVQAAVSDPIMIE